jgi:hypothetical protein
MLTRRRRASTQTQTIACLENAASYSTVPQATGFALLTPPGEKDVATQSRSHSYGWPGSIGYDQNPLVLASEGREDKTHAESSVVPGCDEQASVYHYQCGSWGQHSFGDQVFADNPSLGLSTYPSQNIFLQSLYDSYPSQEGTSTSVKVESSSTSSIHSFPAYAETETQFPVPKVGKAEQPTSQHSGSTINLDNLDSLTRAAVLDLIRNGNK